MATHPKPTILCIGGGFASVTFAKAFTASGANVVVVDPKSFFNVTFASLRSVVKPDSDVGQKHIWEYKNIPGLGRFVQGKVVKLTRHSATLESGEEIAFDCAIVATGSTNTAGVYAQPQALDVAGRKAELKVASAGIEAAKSIIVVGAGYVGLELTAEIAEAWAGKKVTLICAGPKLLDTKSPKVTKTATKWFKDHKVEVLYNEKATRVSDTSLTLKSGTELTADLIIWATGARPNTEFLKTTELAAALDGAGRLKVQQDLRVIGYDNIFALGDVNDVKEDKLGYLAHLQGTLTARNIKTLLKNKDAKLKGWVPFNGTPAMFMTLGSTTGIGMMGNCTVPGCMVGAMKSKNLFVDKFRGQLGVKA